MIDMDPKGSGIYEITYSIEGNKLECTGFVKDGNTVAYALPFNAIASGAPGSYTLEWNNGAKYTQKQATTTTTATTPAYILGEYAKAGDDAAEDDCPIGSTI